MVGRYRLHLANSRLMYDFTFERHINILNGDSSSGKSEFVNLLQTSLREISGGGKSVADYQTDFDWVAVLTPEDRSLELIKSRIGEENIGRSGLVVSDEDTLFFLKEWDIKNMLQSLDCYVLLVTRTKKGIGSLPYSVKSVYEMVTVGNDGDRAKVSLVNVYE